MNAIMIVIGVLDAISAILFYKGSMAEDSQNSNARVGAMLWVFLMLTSAILLITTGFK